VRVTLPTDEVTGGSPLLIKGRYIVFPRSMLLEKRSLIFDKEGIIAWTECAGTRARINPKTTIRTGKSLSFACMIFPQVDNFVVEVKMDNLYYMRFISE